MAHESQRVFFDAVRRHFPEYFQWRNVLEVGSLDINGSLRDFFQNCNYVGVDIGPGPGVDITCSGHELLFPDESFHTVISAECFEHNPYWQQTFGKMVDLTHPDGLIVFSCAGEGRPEHGTTRSDVGSSPLTVSAGWDYYRNLTPSDFYNEANHHLGKLGFMSWNENVRDYDLYFVALKNQNASDEMQDRFWKLHHEVTETFK